MAGNINKRTQQTNANKKRKPKREDKTRSGSTRKKESTEKERLGNDYWDRVADDVAAGYTGKEDEDKVMNRDEKPGDDEQAKGDE